LGFRTTWRVLYRILQPLHNHYKSKLTRSDSGWLWGEIQQDAFDLLRVALTTDCDVAHYDQPADTELKVDASSVGLGAIQ